MNRREAERRGRKGEGWAAFYLRLCGWRIVAQRVKTPRGEVDLIARRGRIVAFVEVKWRANARDLGQAIDAHRLARVAAAAETLVHRHARQGEDVRIDVLLLAPWRFPRHITNAWMP